MEKIALIPNEQKDPDLVCAVGVAEKIVGLGKKVCVSEKYARCFENTEALEIPSEKELIGASDLVVVIGGDGSIIHTARKAALFGVPIVGINLGRLGYLAELELDEIDRLKDIFEGRYTLEGRMMLSYEVVKSDGTRLSGDPALNDIVLTSLGNTNRVVDIEIFSQEHNAFAGAFRGDGVIVSTPTGSTAYALAAGGPVIDPSLKCLNVVPICTHSLTARPMLFSKDATLRLVNSGRVTVNVSADGSDEYAIDPGEYVMIGKSEYYAQFVRVGNSSFYEVLRSKMAEN